MRQRTVEMLFKSVLFLEYVYMKSFPMRGTACAVVIAAAVAASAMPSIAATMATPMISVVSPAANATVRGTSIPVTVAIQHFNLECGNVGKTNAPMGEGHVHVMVDGMDMAHLIGPFCSKNIAIPGQGLSAGKHVLTVALANDAHALNSMPVSVPFVYEPSSANGLPSAMAGGKPALAVLSPKNGERVGKRFNLVLGIESFDLSCALEGKPNVAGWGHVHVFVQQAGETSAAPATPMVAMMQTPEGMKMGQMLMQSTGMTGEQLKPMLTMAQPALVGMPCSKTVPVDLSNWHAGPAKIIVQLANNDHMPTMGTAPAIVEVNVK